MYPRTLLDESKLALVADVGRSALRLGLTDSAGRLRRETIRSYEPSQHSTIAGALASYGQASALDALPRRCAIAVSGAPRGDTISVTNSPWFVSRPGLTAMLQAPPLILNDFAANAWAITAPDGEARVEPVTPRSLDPTEPGTRCLIGVGSGLGVAVCVQDARGLVSVLPTEAGHCHAMVGLPEIEPLLPLLRRGRATLSAEDLLSARGLVAIHEALRRAAGTASTARDARTVARLAASGHDRFAVRAAEIFVRTLWHFAGNLALAYGAWDGVMVTGGIATALNTLLRDPVLAEPFAVASPFQRQLRDVPRALVTLDHAELRGAAQALLLLQE